VIWTLKAIEFLGLAWFYGGLAAIISQAKETER
jgi:hypothetical protein